MLTANFIIWYGDDVVCSNIAPILEVVKIVGDVNPTDQSIATIHIKVIEDVGNGKNERIIRVPYEIITSKDVFCRGLTKHLVFFNLKYILSLQNYLNGQIRLLRKLGGSAMEYDELGWQTLQENGKEQFVLENCFIDGTLYEYKDKTIEFRKGTIAGQKAFLDAEILPYKHTRLAMTLGLSSIVAGYIEDTLGIGSLVINVCGRSSTGKSTITELAGSFYANPKLSNNGIVRGFNATKNALLAASEGRHGLPILLDDLNANRSEHDRVNLVYQFAGNEPRGRCHNTGTLQAPRKGWNGLVLITSEAPMFDNESVPQGVNARILVLSDIVWTNDAEHSDRIKKGVRSDFGHIGLEFANIVSTIGKDKIITLHTKAQEDIKKYFKDKDELADRLALKFAAIKVTADLIKEHYYKNFNTNEVLKLLGDAYAETMITRAIEETALEDLKDFISANKKHFDVLTDTQKKEHSGEFYGAFIINKKEQTANISKSAFDKFLKEKKIQERKRILNYWAKHGYIKIDKDHLTVKVRALGDVRFTKLYLSQSEAEFFKGDVHTAHCHNCGAPKEVDFVDDEQEQVLQEITYEEPYDSIEEIFEEGKTTDEN